ncbi:hypothetical protein [Pseudomonas helleri]|uniref:hypothetical protein n=2 Tax=Pseudomonas TaxID=286 RepID=UPI0012966F92|nr:hypothetical protein [Pseudomonas helleri]MQT30475.1 hypothetical protein [Pseudomonas helleri]
MIKSKIRVNNPLTVIAIFSMLTEASAAVSLPYIDRENQKIYVWFLIVFPSILITLFFLTLNFNNKTLYTPMDYPKENARATPEPAEPEGRITRARPAVAPGSPACQTAPLLSKPGIKFISYSPKNFIFLPQGHRDYDSILEKTTHKKLYSVHEEQQLTQDEEGPSSLYLIDFSHPSLRLNNDHTLGDILQTYYEMAHPKKECLHKNDILLLLTSSSLTSQWSHQQRLELDTKISSHLGDAMVITYNTQTRQLNTLS